MLQTSQPLNRPFTASVLAVTLLVGGAPWVSAPLAQPGMPAQPAMPAPPSDLEGTAGTETAAPPGQPFSLSDLEGEIGHDSGVSIHPESPPGDGPPVSPPGNGTMVQPLDDGIQCSGTGPCIETKTQLPLRVLPRPFSNLHSTPNADPASVQLANLPAFRPLYAFARRDLDLRDGAEPRGWYQVGRTRGQPEGWMQAKDVFEWRQALLVSYTHPGDAIEGRKPVLLFREQAALQAILDDMDMAGRAQQLYSALDAGQTPQPVISMEPKRFVDINDTFYMLPILNWSQTQILGDDARLLQLAAAVPGARGADTLDNPDYREQVDIGRDQPGQDIQALQIDVVFVMDTTRSMQPFIDMTRDTAAKLARDLVADEDNQERFRFGLVGYRDSLKAVPALEYVTRNFTPSLVPAEQLAELLTGEVQATRIGSLGYDEDVFAGVKAALEESQWRKGATGKDSLRFVILIGDASSHPKGSEHSATNMDEHELRAAYDQAGVHLLAMHLRNPKAAEDFPRAEQQFSTLARIRGDATATALFPVDTSTEQSYRTAADDLLARIKTQLGRALGKETEPPAGGETVKPIEQIVDKLWEAALIEYIGQDAQPPKDVVAWALDRDLINPADRALEVRVLVTRDQLNSLAQALDSIMQALMRSEVTQGKFFEALQSISGQTMKRPEDLAQAGRLADTGLLPAFIESLPYQSSVLALTEDMFASMTAEQRSQLELGVLAKLEQYRAINESVDAWVRLNDQDPDSEMVYPLPVDYLP